MAKPDFNIAREHILSRLEKWLSQDLYYHNIEHTKDVLEATERLARLEGISGEDLLLLKTAALYHDTGYMKQYSKNESIGVEIAKETLPNFGYTQKQIKIISEIMMATQLPQKPKTKLQEIICDADLDNLGREDFFIKTEQLRLESEKQGVKKTAFQWAQDNIKFLESHKYFTDSAQKLRNKRKEKNLIEIYELTDEFFRGRKK